MTTRWRRSSVTQDHSVNDFVGAVENLSPAFPEVRTLFSPLWRLFLQRPSNEPTAQGRKMQTALKTLPLIILFCIMRYQVIWNTTYRSDLFSISVPRRKWFNRNVNVLSGKHVRSPGEQKGQELLVRNALVYLPSQEQHNAGHHRCLSCLSRGSIETKSIFTINSPTLFLVLIQLCTCFLLHDTDGTSLVTRFKLSKVIIVFNAFSSWPATCNLTKSCYSITLCARLIFISY